jgi:LysM repeat protein
MGSGRNMVKIAAALLVNPILLAALVVPAQTEAFCLFWCGTAKVEAQVIAPNSQSAVLALQSVNSPSPTDASTTKEDINIIGGTSLVPETVLPGDKDSVDSDQISLYVVHQGDTLPAIAAMFGVSVNTIRWGNDIKGNTISVGQTLVILPISGVQHIVKAGDTIQSIAKLHKGDIDEIMQYNNLTSSSKLKVGDIVIVPDGENVATTPSKTTSSGGKVPVYEGYYMRPIIGGVKTQGIHGHNGVDLASSYGANILASADGEVLIAKSSGWNGGYGEYIVLKHGNGTQTLYGHLSGVLVSVGDHVTQGQVIGKMGNSGQVTGHTGIHLHFEVRGARNPF